jgi:hypothetical protein
MSHLGIVPDFGAVSASPSPSPSVTPSSSPNGTYGKQQAFFDLDRRVDEAKARFELAKQRCVDLLLSIQQQGAAKKTLSELVEIRMFAVEAQSEMDQAASALVSLLALVERYSRSEISAAEATLDTLMNS